MGQDNAPIWRRSATHVLHAALLLRHIVEQQLTEATGLLLADNEALLHLDHAETPLRMTDIAESVVLSRGGTTKVVDRLERLGLVERQVDPADRRATLVALTDTGTTALAEARSVIDEALHTYWGRHLDNDEAATLLQLVAKVADGNEW